MKAVLVAYFNSIESIDITVVKMETEEESRARYRVVCTYIESIVLKNGGEEIVYNKDTFVLGRQNSKWVIAEIIEDTYDVDLSP